MNSVFKIKFLWCFGLVFGLFLIKPKTIFACTNGATQCSGSSIQVCINGFWSTTATCGYGCANGKCKLCSSGDKRCYSGNVQTCNDSGSAWYTSTTCSYGCTGAKCNAFVCTAGTMKCSDGDAYVCSDNAWGLYQDCSYGCTESTDTYAFCNAGVSCCNSFLGSGCYASLSSSQMCKTGSYVSDSAYLDEYPNLGDTSWRWACQADTLNCISEDCAASYCVSACKDGGCGSSNGASVCTWGELTNLCSSTYGSVITDNIGSDGTYQWTCNGQSAAVTVCSPSGTAASCAATKIPSVTKVDGACSAINGTVVQTKPLSTELCTSGTPSGYTGTVNYSWSCVGTNGVCPASTAASPPCSATLDTPPTPEFIIIPIPGLNDPTPNPSGGVRLNNCQNDNPNIIPKIEFKVTDANGLSDIAAVYFKFKGLATEYGPLLPNASGIVTFNNIDVSTLADGTYTIQAKTDDVHASTIGSNWVDLAFTFKKWDCQVTVDGTIYDNSANLACNNSNTQGFTQTIPADIDPFEFVYEDRLDSSIREMTVSSPRFYSPKTLTWQREYFLSNFDESDNNFLGVLKTLKINDVCLPANSTTLPRNHVDPYVSNPTINIKYGAIMDQESWFRVTDGTVISKVEARNYVPVTCVDDCMTTINGIVWAKNVNTPKSNDESLWSEIQPKIDPNTYTALKYDIKSGLNIGTTFVVDTTYGKTSLNWSEIKDTREIIFIDGDFTIDEDINISPSDYLLIIVSGKITILPNVNLVEGMFFANTTIEASGDSDTQLVVSGSLYGKTGVTLSRTYTKKRDNNTNPAVRVVYDPNLIFKLPQRMWETYENWRME